MLREASFLRRMSPPAWCEGRFDASRAKPKILERIKKIEKRLHMWRVSLFLSFLFCKHGGNQLCQK
ncbi:hypothetical protein CHH70_01175 [Shouchella clausii]|nr:hypothetical protein CHH70_01175 [Shouchella clausii]